MRTLLFIATLLLASCATTSYNRQELYNKEVSKYQLKDTDTLLDIGCGRGLHDRQLAYLYPNMFFILEDIDAKHLNQIRRFNTKGEYAKVIKSRFELVLGTIDSIPLKSNTYKKILCRKTLHEFSNPTKMIKELKRLLAVDGELIIVEPIAKYEGQIFKDCKHKFLNQEQIISMVKTEGMHLKSAETFTSDFNDIQNGNVLIFTK